jgi:HSP20 family molecular chaperone IbpA
MSGDRPDHDAVVEATEEAAASMRLQRVPINAYTTSEALVIVAPLPAVRASDVQVELDAEVVRFVAALRSAGPREYLVNEWDYGGYERELELPEGFGGGVEAVLANGQLTVRVLRGTTDRTIRIEPTER